jgi:uracil-DNA glycosylase
MDRRRTVTWNVVPWYIGSGTKIRAATGTDLGAGRPALVRLLSLLPRLKAIVLLGRKA